MNELKDSDLTPIVVGDPGFVSTHFAEVEPPQSVSGCETKIHCHCLTVDANGKVKVARLAEYLRASLIDYAIPRSKIKEAKIRDEKYKSNVALTNLHYEAKNLFTDLEKTGESGEILLYVLAQHILKLPQVFCKMDLKTDHSMHYHGADGVYAGVADDGVLKLYWGESKIYADSSESIKECIKSIAPFLLENDGEHSARERDIVLLSDKADLDNPDLTRAFKVYFDRSNPKSNSVRYCGIALAGFSADLYSDKSQSIKTAAVVAAAKVALKAWIKSVEKQIPDKNLSKVEIQLFLIPFPSAQEFRDEFLKALGI